METADQQASPGFKCLMVDVDGVVVVRPPGAGRWDSAIETDLGIREADRFDVLHYSAAYGAAKPSSAFFQTVSARSGYPPGDLMLIDDYPANIESARACGWQARLWTGHEPLHALLSG